MNAVLAAIAPVVLLLGLGAFVGRSVLTDRGDWAGLEWFSYYVFTPALLMRSTVQADLDLSETGPLVLSLAVPLLIVAGIAWASGILTGAGGPALTSLVQGSIRINTYIGLALAAALAGTDGVASFAIATAVVIPMVNVVCVASLARYGARLEGGPRPRLIRELGKNPLIVSCVAGVSLSGFGLGVPAPAATMLHLLSAPALAAGTLIAGSAITIQLRRSHLVGLGISTTLKLVALPAGAAALATGLNVSGTDLTAVVLVTAVPTAPSATLLAAKMGGDVALMAAITGAQTVMAVVTLPTVLTVLLAAS